MDYIKLVLETLHRHPFYHLIQHIHPYLVPDTNKLIIFLVFNQRTSPTEAATFTDALKKTLNPITIYYTDVRDLRVDTATIKVLLPQ